MDSFLVTEQMYLPKNKHNAYINKEWKDQSAYRKIFITSGTCRWESYKRTNRKFWILAEDFSYNHEKQCFLKVGFYTKYVSYNESNINGSTVNYILSIAHNMALSFKKKTMTIEFNLVFLKIWLWSMFLVTAINTHKTSCSLGHIWRTDVP